MVVADHDLFSQKAKRLFGAWAFEKVEKTRSIPLPSTKLLLNLEAICFRKNF